MLWIKAFHIIFMVTWFAGLFYLPRLFVYHALASDQTSIDRFKVMQRKLFFGIMTPSAILTLAFGFWLWLGYGFSGSGFSGYGFSGFGFSAAWLNIKLVLVILLIVYHLWCYQTLLAFRNDANSHSSVFYRWMNELPALLLVGIILLVVVKPF